MKKSRILAIAAITAIFLSGCKKEKQEVMPDPVINVDSETVIDLPPAGGSASFEYQIDNPVEGGQFKAEPEDTWMSSFTCEDGKVNFNVEANKEEEARTSSITLVYTYSGDKTVEATVNVSQEVMQQGEVPVPTIVITSTEPLSFTADGGQYSLEYEIKDAAQDGKISAEAGDAGWISGFNCDEAGVVSFNVESNTEPEERTATITLTYTYNGSETVNATIEAVQDAAAQGGEDAQELEMSYRHITYYGSNPELHSYYTIISTGPVDENSTVENGSTYLILDLYAAEGEANEENPLPTAGTYTVSETKANMTAWIGGFAPSKIRATDNNGNSTLNAKLASGTVDVSYEDDNLIIEATVTDENGNSYHAVYTGPIGETTGGGDEEYDYVFEMTHHLVKYYSGSYNNFVLSITDKPYKDDFGSYADDANACAFDLYASGGQTGDNPLPPAGIYTASKEYKDMIFSISSYYSTIKLSGNPYSIYIADGTVTISYEGETMTVDAIFTDTSGATYHATYTGSTAAVN